METRDSPSVFLFFKLRVFYTSVSALKEFGIPLKTEGGPAGLSRSLLPFSFDITICPVFLTYAYSFVKSVILLGRAFTHLSFSFSL